MLEMNYLCLLVVVGTSLLSWAVVWARLRTGAERFFLTVCMGGLLFYSGIGAAYVPVYWSYVLTYCCFALIFPTGFAWGVSISRKFARRQRAAYENIDRLERSLMFRRLALGSYVTISILPLLLPEFRLSLLWNPPTPDLLAVFHQGITENASLASRIIGYAALLAWPFYLLAMYSLRRRYIALAIYAIFPAYCRYCSLGYLGRYEMLLCGALYFGVIWLDRPAVRLRLTVLAWLCIPFLLVFFEAYSQIRVGGKSNNEVSMVESIQRVAVVETTFPLFWDRVVSSGRHADLGVYATWIVTLPLPKLLTGDIAGLRMNIDINEIISTVALGSSGYSINLTGAVVESEFIYGPYFFWIHAATVGVLAGLLCGLTGGSRSLLLVFVSLSLTFGYVFMRAGIGGSLPTIVNGYLTLYCWMFVLTAGSHARSSARTPTNALVVSQGQDRRKLNLDPHGSLFRTRVNPVPRP
jgi:hypothetical protein